MRKKVVRRTHASNGMVMVDYLGAEIPHYVTNDGFVQKNYGFHKKGDRMWVRKQDADKFPELFERVKIDA